MPARGPISHAAWKGKPCPEVSAGRVRFPIPSIARPLQMPLHLLVRIPYASWQPHLNAWARFLCHVTASTVSGGKNWNPDSTGRSGVCCLTFAGARSVTSLDRGVRGARGATRWSCRSSIQFLEIATSRPHYETDAVGQGTSRLHGPRSSDDSKKSWLGRLRVGNAVWQCQSPGTTAATAASRRLALGVRALPSTAAESRLFRVAQSKDSHLPLVDSRHGSCIPPQRMQSSGPTAGGDGGVPVHDASPRRRVAVARVDSVALWRFGS